MPQLFALTALLLASPSMSSPEASELWRKSVTDYKLGYYDDALKEIEEAYRLDPRPALLFDLGQCHRAMEHWERAEFFYRSYLNDVPNARNRTAVLALIDQMGDKKRAAATAKAAAAAATPPPPAPAPSLVLVEAPTPAPTPAVSEAPAAEIKATGSHSRVWPWVLGSGAVVFAGGCAWGWYEAATFPSYKVAPHTLGQLQGQQTLATAGFVTAIAGGAIAAALFTGAVLTW